MPLTTAQRYSDEHNTVRVLRERLRDGDWQAVVQRANLLPSHLNHRYVVGATPDVSPEGHELLTFVDGSTARCRDNRWSAL